ncbi:MAG TPA: hypothetical protein VFF73_31850 [Planctomycetota bacterium]|nr:hypothetical protein [Planctomycetota bacterium]
MLGIEVPPRQLGACCDVCYPEREEPSREHDRRLLARERLSDDRGRVGAGEQWEERGDSHGGIVVAEVSLVESDAAADRRPRHFDPAMLLRDLLVRVALILTLTPAQQSAVNLLVTGSLRAAAEELEHVLGPVTATLEELKQERNDVRGDLIDRALVVDEVVDLAESSVP